MMRSLLRDIGTILVARDVAGLLLMATFSMFQRSFTSFPIDFTVARSE